VKVWSLSRKHPRASKARHLRIYTSSILRILTSSVKRKPYASLSAIMYPYPCGLPQWQTVHIYSLKLTSIFSLVGHIYYQEPGMGTHTLKLFNYKYLLIKCI